MAVRLLRVSCAKCGGEVDRVEYDEDGTANAASVLSSALGLSADDAEKLLRDHGAAPDQKGKELARAIAAKEVADRDEYVCSDADCDGTELEVSE